MENRLHKIACRIQKEGVVRREYGHAYVADDMEKGLDLRPRLEAKEAIGREIAKRLEDFHTVLRSGIVCSCFRGASVRKTKA